MTAAIIGIVLALTAVIVYITRSWTTSEKEKATSELDSKMALDRLSEFERAQIKKELERRTKDKNETADLPRATSGTRLLPDKDGYN